MGNNQAENPAASYLFKLFNSDKIIPLKCASDFLSLIPGLDKDVKQEILSGWKNITDEFEEQGKKPRDINAPVILTRGIPENSDEESLRFYFPEEKILINKNVFRKKMSDLDFPRLNPQAERKIIDELKNESIGLNDQEVIIYYNLLKADILARSMSVNNGAVKHSPEIIVSSDYTIVGQGPFDYAEKIIDLIEENFSALNKLAAVNERRQPDRSALAAALKSKLVKPVYNPRVYCLLCGFEIDKYAVFIKEFLSVMSSRWGGNIEEIYSYYSAYLLLNSAAPARIDELELSVSLKNFINDNLGRIHPVFYCSIIFITIFTYILVMQVMEISSKYFSSPEMQKEKLAKLYDSEERITMLINNAFNIASGKIASYKAETREITANMKKHLSRNKKLITPDDIFKTRYNF